MRLTAGLRPDLLGELIVLPRSLSWIKGKRQGGREGREWNGRGKRRERRMEGGSLNPEIPRYATTNPHYLLTREISLSTPLICGLVLLLHYAKKVNRRVRSSICRADETLAKKHLQAGVADCRCFWFCLYEN